MADDDRDDYTASDLEREVLDPLFYRYERALRDRFSHERTIKDLRGQVAELTRSNQDSASLMVSLKARSDALHAKEVQVAQLKVERDRAMIKMRELYRAAAWFGCVLDRPTPRTPKQVKEMMGHIETALIDLRAALKESYEFCEQVPF